MRALGDRAQAVGPARVEVPGADGGLGDVIDDERLLRVPIDERDRLRQVLREDQHVVDQAVPAQPGDAAVDVVTQQVVVVGLVVDDVADAAEPAIGAQPRQRVLEIRGDERHPADDAGDALGRRGQGEHPLRLVDPLLRVHQDGAVDAGAGERRLELGQAVVLPQRRHRLGDPRQARLVEAPEMVMGVENHGLAD